MVCSHVSMLCCSQDKKGQVYVYQGGSVVSTGHIIIFRERDQNGPAALFHCYLDGKWNFGRAPSAGLSLGSLIVASAASCISTENGMHRNLALNSGSHDVVVRITKESTRVHFGKFRRRLLSYRSPLVRNITSQGSPSPIFT